MGATVDQIKDKVATDTAAASPAPLEQAPAPVAVAVAPVAVEPVAVAPVAAEPAQQQQAQAGKGVKTCTALVATATDQWCQNTCSEVPSQIVAVTPTSYCPKEICSCK